MVAMVPYRERREFWPTLERPFRMLREEFEPIFERLLGMWPHPFEMTETEKEYVVRAELPGFEPAEVEVTLRGSVLTIEAKHVEKPKEAAEEKEAEKEAEEEPRYTHVRRSVTLPEGAELEKLEAEYRNGVLEVKVPKTPEVQARRIEVKA
jgi:HSP20 family protein